MRFCFSVELTMRMGYYLIEVWLMSLKSSGNLIMEWAHFLTKTQEYMLRVGVYKISYLSNTP
jgi:hypothetical protein